MKQGKLIWVLVVAAVLGVIYYLVFRQDPLTAYINSKFPPVTAEQHRTEAVSTAARALSQLPRPNVGFGASLTDINTALGASPELKTIGVTRIRLSGDSQLLLVEAAFTKHFDESYGLGEAGSLLATLRPEVTGTIKLYAGVTGAASDVSKPMDLQLKLLPSLHSVSVDHVMVSGSYNVTAAGEALAAALNKYAENVTGELARSPIMNISVPTLFHNTTDPSQLIRLQNGDVNAIVQVSGQTPQIVLRLLGIAALVTDSEISAVAMVAPIDTSVESASQLPVPSYEEYRLRYEAMLVDSFDKPAGTASWVALRRDLMSNVVNNAVRSASLSVSASAELTEQRFNKEISFPDETTVDCSPTRVCPERPCDFSASHDTRSCNRCILWRPGWPLGDGGCAQEGNDPICELEKAAQNNAYELEAAAKKFDCERLKIQEKLICEAEKASEKALCEAGKEGLKRLSRTGKFARIDGSLRARTEGLSLSLASFNISEGMDNVSFTVNPSGSAIADVSLKFIPLDIVGHLTCAAPWTEEQTFQATLRESSISITGNAHAVLDGTAIHLAFEVDPGIIALQLSPSPTEFLMNSTNMALACQGLNLVRPIIFAAGAVIPEMKGEINLKLDKQTAEIDIAMPKLSVGTTSMTTRLTETPKAWIMSGTLSTQ